MFRRPAFELLHNNQRSSFFSGDMMVQMLGLDRILDSHENMINALCWSSDGKYLLSGSEDSVVKLWSVDGNLLHSHTTSAVGFLNCLRILPFSAENVFAYNDSESNFVIHDFQRQEPLANVGVRNVLKIATSDTSPYCIYCFGVDSSMSVYDVRCGKALIMPFNLDATRTSFDICRDRSELFAFGSKDGSISVFDTRNCFQRVMLKLSSAENSLMVTKNSRSAIKNVHFNDSGTEIIVNDQFGTGYLFDLNGSSFELRGELQKLLEKGSTTKQTVSENGDITCFQRTVEMMQELMRKQRYSKAIELSLEALCQTRINNPLQLSVIRHMRTLCFSKRRWNGDKYMCLKEIMKAYDMNPSNCHILYDLIKHLASMGQFHLASSFIDLYRTKFSRNQGPSIDLLHSQILYNDRKPHPQYFHLMNECPLKDYKERFVALNNVYSELNDLNYFGCEQRYIVAPTRSGSFVVYDKSTSLIKNALHVQDSSLLYALPNPVQPIIATVQDNGNIKIWQPKSSNEQDVNRVDDFHNLGRFFTPTIESINDRSYPDDEDIIVEGDCRIS